MPSRDVRGSDASERHHPSSLAGQSGATTVACLGSSSTAEVWMPRLPGPWLRTTKCSLRYIEQLVSTPERGGMMSGEASWRCCTLSRKPRPALPEIRAIPLKCALAMEGLSVLGLSMDVNILQLSILAYK